MNTRSCLVIALVLAAGSAGCDRNRDHNNNNSSNRSTQSPHSGNYNSSSGNSSDSGMTMSGARNEYTSQSMSGDADARILSLLHAKNQEEIQAGQLARTNGASQDVRQYGDMLVRHHTDADTKVMSTARTANIQLMSMQDVNAMISREKGQQQPNNDALADLRGWRGAEFDRIFARRMQEGHRELIAKVQTAQSEVRNQQVRGLLDEMLPTLRQHEQEASRPVSSTMTSSSGQSNMTNQNNMNNQNNQGQNDSGANNQGGPGLNPR